MAETKDKATTPQPATNFDLETSMHRAEDFFARNKNVITIALVAVVVVVGGFFAYNRFVKQPNENKAQEMVFHAQNYFAVDSFKLALNGDGNNYGFLQVVNKYGGTKAGNLAKYSAGVCYIRLGEYQKGIDMLKDFSSDDLLLQPTAYGLSGDAYMELNKVNEGIEAYKKAGHYNDNELTAPVYLFRAGLALEKAGKAQDAVVIYKEIKEKFPLSNEGREMDKYLARLGDVKN
ncbi:tetratricopeptide repeat protein [Chitinophaga nivalis]|uniref:Tetratricopeptide repeat protein n=1 Tax=Chitinophaga nivalis TaxID=2991709 RepID=A0ABT3ILP4_9BACT|nr:tetratricopeptide repeat protein [Chitinophaga nivalis]MCW3465619.1 tetratricopeptide repeat protein [Chitinophaga nivalis]MCW3484690.1 tetratricopeptide repeat protein [Chitinophaga nivalis]